MTEAEQNALRSSARRCNEELHQAVAANPKTPFDKLSGPIIKRYYQPIESIHRLVDFMWTIAVLNGQFKER